MPCGLGIQYDINQPRSMIILDNAHGHRTERFEDAQEAVRLQEEPPVREAVGLDVARSPEEKTVFGGFHA